MSNRLPVATYAAVPLRRWRRGTLALVACGLGVLQACSGADAVAPIERASVPVAAPVTATARITRINTDTAVAGGLVYLEGEQLGATASPLRATLDGVELPVHAVSPTRLELSVPAQAFACAAVRTVSLTVSLPTSRFDAELPLRVAQRQTLAVGESVSLTDAQSTRCIELVGTGTGSARYVAAVVNNASMNGASTNAGASFELRGVGTGSAANVNSTVSAAVSSLQGSAQGSAQGRVQGLRSALVGASTPHEEQGAHGALLQQQRLLAEQGGSAVSAWQGARASAGVRAGAVTRSALTRTLQLGDTTTLTAIAGNCNAGRAVRARVVYAGSRAVVLEDIAAPRAGAMDLQYRQLGGEFDSVVYPLLADQVGDPLAMNGAMQGDGRVTMLFTRFVNDSLSGTAGYVSACNFYPRSKFAASNQDELFYARVAGANETPDEWRRAMRATVVHEAKHLASFAERLSRGTSFEEPWLEEATARVAEELYARTFGQGTSAGTFRTPMSFAASVGCELTQCDDRPLIMWKHFSGLHTWLRSVEQQPAGQVMAVNGAALTASAANAGYSSGWALVRWVLDTHAASERVALRDLVAGRSGVGMAALTTLTQRDEASLLTAWAMSLGVQGDSETSLLSGSSWQWRDIIGGMATMFPGAYSAQPLPITSLTFGTFTLPQRTLAGTASYVALQGPASGASQILELRVRDVAGQAAMPLSLALSRTR